jgi:hypothetical protein
VLEQIRVVISLGLLMLLLLLRTEAERFGAAEYDEPERFPRGPWTRFSWYALGLLLLAGLYLVHPRPHDVLYLILGLPAEALTYGLLLAVAGVAQAAAFAYWRYRELRLPPGRAYPGAAANEIATAVIDEATFRGALLGVLLAVRLPAPLAVVTQALIYAQVTRLGAPGRHPYMLALSLGIGLLGGWATLQTGGIGAAIIGHAMASFGLFTFTGHAGQVEPRDDEPGEVARRRRAPEGWQDARILLARARRARSGQGPES